MKIYNTLSREKENFVPIKSNLVSIYVCGITPYDTTHLGHAFVYVSFDVLIRYLKYKNLKVNYTQNVTDINDRDNDILKRAKEQNIPWQKLSVFWTEKFLDDMKALNWTFPSSYLYASEQIDNIVKLIDRLIENKIAYMVNGSVYLDVSKDKNYGKLSRLSKDKMIKIAKDYDEDIENPNKRNVLDITLWRASSPNQSNHIPSFKSHFGKGRPGWHIECSAMAISTLGEQIDIHGGGKDLIFPHHEAEIAQSENATKKFPFVKTWMHTGIISYGGEKMSKSLGNLIMVSDLLEKYSPNAIKWVLLSHHYREDWEFDYKEADNAIIIIFDIKKALNKKLVDNKNDIDYIKQFELFMDDDLDTPKALNLIYEISRNINSNKETSKKVQENLKSFLEILGFKFN